MLTAHPQSGVKYVAGALQGLFDLPSRTLPSRPRGHHARDVHPQRSSIEIGLKPNDVHAAHAAENLFVDHLRAWRGVDDVCLGSCVTNAGELHERKCPDPNDSTIQPQDCDFERRPQTIARSHLRLPDRKLPTKDTHERDNGCYSVYRATKTSADSVRLEALIRRTTSKSPSIVLGRNTGHICVRVQPISFSTGDSYISNVERWPPVKLLYDINCRCPTETISIRTTLSRIELSFSSVCATHGLHEFVAVDVNHETPL
ncbi:hypothetical protein NA57DRAFT_57746 [Rhizodiscina lignyota]|uniref:Uncharacterized protein n=1 Tax=Rhizodiscina lignyota TaxID=1504668 RepID=A0A9P4I8H8_9PEZI|nr:hypothetical protein NA57DRAFT_57746 [Rhizodiscina lignyota]